MTSLTRHAYAKINLTLDVGAHRADGYHDIRSVVQTVALHDTLTLTQTPATPGIRLEVTGAEAAGVPADDSNLVYRAAHRLLPDTGTGLHILLHKRIPSQAGLGGGSSDAAATLRAARDFMGLPHSQEDLIEFGAALGADVPFFLFGGTALIEGRGERVTPLPELSPSWPLVIVKPSVGVSTAAAYAALDADSERRPGQATAAWLRDRQALGNDFERVVFPRYPEITAAHQALRWTTETGESFSPRLCGSGSALFCRVRTPEQAEDLASLVRSAGIGKVWVTQTTGARTQ